MKVRLRFFALNKKNAIIAFLKTLNLYYVINDHIIYSNEMPIEQARQICELAQMDLISASIVDKKDNLVK